MTTFFFSSLFFLIFFRLALGSYSSSSSLEA
jgi:hypothetical protein